MQDLWSSLRRGRWLLLGITAATVAVVMVVTLIVAPVYESEATLRIRSESGSRSLMPDLGALGSMGLPGFGRDEVDTEMGILRSRRISTAITDSLNLHVQLTKPTQSRSDILNVHQADTSAVAGRYTMRRESDGSYSLTVQGARERVEAPRRVEIGTPFTAGNVGLSLAPALREDPPRTIEFRVEPVARAAEATRKSLKVDRQAIGSSLVEVTFRHRNPETAAAVVNQAVEQYVSYKALTDRSESRYTIDVLREQSADYAVLLAEAEETLRSFRERQRIVAPEEQATQQVRRIAEVQARNDATRIERQALSSLLRQIQVRSGTESGIGTYRQLATFPSFISNGAVQDILQNLISLENQRTGLLARRTETNPDVEALTRRIQELEDQLYLLGTNYLQSLDTQMAAASAALSAFGRELEAVPAQEVQHARLARDQMMLSEVYLMLQRQLNEAEITEAIETEDVRIVDYAIVPEKPVFPNRVVNFALAIVLGLMAGVTVVVGRGLISGAVHSPADVEAAAAGLPVLATIPFANSTGASRNGKHRRWIEHIAVRRAAPPSIDPLIVRGDPWGPPADAYRSLAATLELGDSEGAHTQIVLTSPRGSDGTSVVAANLAITLAQRGARTLLIDADVRDGQAESLFGITASHGLTDVLRGRVNAEQAIREVDLRPQDGELHLLAAGILPEHPGRLLTTSGFRTLLDELAGRYAYILIDAPALDAGPEARLLGSICDATLLVVRNGITDRDDLHDAATLLHRSGISVAGVVLDGSPLSQSPVAL